MLFSVRKEYFGWKNNWESSQTIRTTNNSNQKMIFSMKIILRRTISVWIQARWMLSKIRLRNHCYKKPKRLINRFKYKIKNSLMMNLIWLDNKFRWKTRRKRLCCRWIIRLSTAWKKFQSTKGQLLCLKITLQKQTDELSSMIM